MKKFTSFVCLLGAVVALSACSSNETYQDTPYQSRTAGTGVVGDDAQGERVFSSSMRK